MLVGVGVLCEIKNEPQNEIAKIDEKSFNKCSIMGAQKEKVLKMQYLECPLNGKQAGY